MITVASEPFGHCPRIFPKRPGRFLALPEASEGASGRPGRRRFPFFHILEVSGRFRFS